MSRSIPTRALLVPAIVLVCTASAAAQEAPGGTCLTCHAALGGRLAVPAQGFPGDIHAAKGFGCIACHGGDETIAGLGAMDPDKGYVGVPDHLQVLEVCGRCHSDAEFMKRYNPSLRVDQVTEYLSSTHGRRLTSLEDPNVATCVSCHPAHSIRPPTDPASSVHPMRVADTCGQCHANADYMETYGLGADQVEKYRRSVHWRMLADAEDLAAPTCNDCHGNHGAAPPGISWVGNVCGQCHAVMAGHFSGSRHARTFTLLGIPGCATCHRNHEILEAGDDMLGLGESAFCRRCHSGDDPGGAAAAQMRALIDSLRLVVDTAGAVLLHAEHAGMEVSQAQFELQGARDALVKARAAVHSFEVDSVRSEVEAGLAIAGSGFDRGLAALRELRVRRIGLWVSVAIILLLIGGLVMRIRQIE